MIQSFPNPTQWQYWRCPTDTDPAAFGPFADMAALWVARRGQSQVMPARQAFDFSDFRNWWGRVAIARIEAEPFDVRFSLWGTQLTEWWGVDYSNKRLGEAAKNPEAWLQTEGRYFALMADQPFIGIACGRLDQHDRSFKKVLGFDLPLGRNGHLTHVLACHIEISLDATPPTVLPDCPMSPVDVISPTAGTGL